MTYATGQIITTPDFNTIATRVSSHMGVGTGNKGLGQNVSPLSNVAPTSIVTATQWTSLLQATSNCLVHEGLTPVTPSTVVAGDIITIVSALDAKAQAVVDNAGTTGLALTDGASNTTSFSTAWGTTGSRGLQHAFTVTFASGDHARYFFNAGGRIKLSLSQTGGASTTRNTEWAALCAAFGSLQFGYKNTTKVGGSGTMTTLLNANNGGYWNSTGSYTLHASQYDGVAQYSTNHIDAYLMWSGTPSNGGYPVLSIAINLVNTWANAFQDPVDGTCSAGLVVSSPSATYLANTWGTPTITKGSAAF